MTPQERTILLRRVDQALDSVRPHLAVDGGNVEVVDITDELQVKIRWTGNCESCSMSAMTLRAGLEQAIKGAVPEIRGVIPINGVQ